MSDLSHAPKLIWLAGKFAAAMLVAGSAVFVFWTAALLKEQWHTGFTGTWRALLVAVVYGLGTCVWSVSSQSLWQHGPNEFFLAAGIYCLTRVGCGRWPAILCGAAYGMAVLCRPDSALVVLVVGVYLLIRDRRALLYSAVGGLPLAAGLAVYNGYYLGSVLTFGQELAGARIAEFKTGSPGIWQTPLAEGLPGILLSPSRGLFVYSPVLIFSLWGAYVCWRDRRWAVLRPLTLVVPAVWLLQAKHFDWWSGWSFGYRHIMDTTTLLAFLMIPIIDRVVRRKVALAVFAVLACFSVGVQFIGATAYSIEGWNGRRAIVVEVPGEDQRRTVFEQSEADELVASRGARIVEQTSLNIDLPEHRHRLWSWTDSQLVYYVTHYATSRQARRAKVEWALGRF